MRSQKISFMSHSRKFIIVTFLLAGSFIFPITSHLAYAHTFSTGESAKFLSLVDQIKAETALTTMNLQTSNDDNATALAQAHAQKASNLLLVENNDTLGEIREVNERIANTLQSGLKNLEGNVTASASSSTTQGQTAASPPPQDRMQSINQTAQSLDDTLGEAVTVRIEQSERNNATTWAMSLADLVNVVLSDYGNATGASFDLTDMSNMASMGGLAGGMQMNNNNSSSDNMTMSGSQMQMSNNSNSSTDNNTMSMTMMTSSNSSMSNAMAAKTTTIVDTAAYQSAQYLANNTILQLFNDTLKPLTISSNSSTSVANNGNNNNNSISMTQQGQNNNSSLNASDSMSNIPKLEAGLLQLRDNINDKANPQEVMMTAHTNIHPLIMQIYGLTLEQEEGEE